MKKNKKIILFTAIIVFIQLSCLAQSEYNFDFLNHDIETILPPLETLIDSAIINNPEVKFRELEIKLNNIKIKSGRTFFTRNMGLQTDVRYGTFDNFSTNTSEGQTPTVIATQKIQTNYGVGLYMKFPLYDFLDRKNQINQAKVELEQSVEMVQTVQRQVRQLVIKQFNDLILKQRLLKIKTKAIETSRINMEMVENEFKNGVTPVVEYTRISQIVTSAEVDLEITRIDFINSFMILEEIVGYKIRLNNNTEKQPDENN